VLPSCSGTFAPCSKRLGFCARRLGSAPGDLGLRRETWVCTGRLGFYPGKARKTNLSNYLSAAGEFFCSSVLSILLWQSVSVEVLTGCSALGDFGSAPGDLGSAPGDLDSAPVKPGRLIFLITFLLQVCFSVLVSLVFCSSRAFLLRG